MSEHSLPTPPGLLLATDLSARCDRPLERAKQLAGQFHSPLTVLTVHDAPQAPADVTGWLDGDIGREREEQLARAELAREFAGSALQVTPRFASGAIDSAILDAAATLPGAIVVTGASTYDSLGGLLLGSTVEKLAHKLQQPLLVVRRRVRGPYRNIMVATDFTAAAQLALQTAVRLFPGCAITVFHAHDNAELLGDDAQGDATTLRAEFARFLAACALPETARAHVTPVIGEGEPASQLTRYVLEHDIDLAVFGLHEESALKRLLAGSRSDQLLQDVACDSLVIRLSDPSGEYP
jgi:nucleotide-binding universal stress UspA family protein